MPKIVKLPISSLKLHEQNPRVVKDKKFKKLVQSVKKFPEMLEIRPIVVNKDMVIIGGNMRYRACVEAKFETVPVMVVDLSPAKEKEFILKDNVSSGEWDYDMLADVFDSKELAEFGVIDFDFSQEELDIAEPSVTKGTVKEEIEQNEEEHEEEISKPLIKSEICPHCGK